MELFGGDKILKAKPSNEIGAIVGSFRELLRCFHQVTEWSEPHTANSACTLICVFLSCRIVGHIYFFWAHIALSRILHYRRLNGLRNLCFDKCIMTQSCHYRIMQNSLTTSAVFLWSIKLPFLNPWQTLAFSLSLLLLFNDVLHLEFYSLQPVLIGGSFHLGIQQILN